MRNVTTARKSDIRTPEFIHRDGMTVNIGDAVNPRTPSTAIEDRVARNSQKIDENRPYNYV